ncbi:Ribosomal protein L1p/L10e family [Novymonas esmeraldas]|uniref:Ribosomal protein L1p/L10e family n=1 Tax=Novymonas esmeraldas TaxID=1808958 RepID=A0AAW0ENW9_9TRYP
MPQDKRLIVTKAVLYKLQRVCAEEDKSGGGGAADQQGIYLEFIVPTVVTAQCPQLVRDHRFHLPHRVYAANGRTTCLVVPKLISHDCGKVNKRHGYYDAVVTAEAICKRGDAEAMKRAARVAATFSHFVVDVRIASKLPHAITDAVKTSASSPAAAGSTAAPSSAVRCPRKTITPLEGLDERETLSFRLSQGSTAGLVESQKQGQLLFRVGHGGMTAGAVCENAKAFVVSLKKEFPTVWRYIHEFSLVSNRTERIRFMEVHIAK